MGKLLPDLDIRLGKMQDRYLNMYSNDDYRKASQFLYQMNSNLPPESKLDSLPVPSITQAGYFEELVGEEQYRDYCDKWAPLVFQAIAIYNEKMLNAYAAATGFNQ